MKSNKEITTDETINVSEAMIKYGGSFVKCLGEALIRADHINRQKIKDTWSEEWDRYLKMFQKML